MLHNIRIQRLSNVNHSNLLVQFISYEEKEVLWIRSLMPAPFPVLSWRVFLHYVFFCKRINCTSLWPGYVQPSCVMFTYSPLTECLTLVLHLRVRSVACIIKLLRSSFTIVTNDASTINMGNSHVTIVSDLSSGVNKWRYNLERHFWWHLEHRLRS